MKNDTLPSAQSTLSRENIAKAEAMGGLKAASWHANRIKEYWAARGFAVITRVETTKREGDDPKSDYLSSVRSNMLDGLPPQAKWRQS